MPHQDAKTIPTLADLEPADAAAMEEVRSLAGTIGSAIAMHSPDALIGHHTKATRDALAAGGRPTDAMHLVMLLVPLLNGDCRAAACSRIGTGTEARPHLDLWLWVARYTLGHPPEGLPLTLAGYAAARAGFASLALDCLDRALASIAALTDANTYRAAVLAGTSPEHLWPHYPPR